MRWFFLRHAYAGESFNETDIMADFRRELTGSGIEELKEVLRTHRPLLQSIKTIYTSPLVRAVQTAEILYSLFPRTCLEILVELDKLAPPELARDRLRRLPLEASCFVGHDPHLSELLRLLGFTSLKLAKSGLALIEGDFNKGFKLELLVAPVPEKFIHPRP